MAKKILIVEDEAELVELMKIRLAASGYEVSSANDGEDGLKKIYEEKPDLVLLDILMPKMNGLELCLKIKADPKTKNIPVVIVSASGGSDLRGRSQMSGANDCIYKPFESSELLEKIRKWTS